MIIRDILALKGGEIYTISPDRPVAEAVNLIVKRGIGSLIVKCDNQECMIGLITERDIVRALSQRDCTLANVKVSDVMVTEPIIGNPEDSVDYVRGVMTENHISHLPVLEGDDLCGIISFHDVAKAALNEADLENSLLKRYIKNWPEEPAT